MRAVVGALVALSLAGCAGMAPRPGEGAREAAPERVAAARVAQQQRAAVLGLATGQCAAPSWQMAGRVALSNGREGGSGRIEWLQGTGRTEVTLSAPVTRQSWTLAIDDSGARLDGVPGGPVRGNDAAALLRTATGWEIPVTALGCWVRGVPADPAVFGEASIVFGDDLLPLRFEQGGWTIDYADWKADGASGTVLPSRINAARGESRVRLIVDRWNAE